MKLIRPITARPVNSAPDSDARNSGFLNRLELEDRIALAELDRHERGEQGAPPASGNDRPDADQLWRPSISPAVRPAIASGEGGRAR